MLDDGVSIWIIVGALVVVGVMVALAAKYGLQRHTTSHRMLGRGNAAMGLNPAHEPNPAMSPSEVRMDMSQATQRPSETPEVGVEASGGLLGAMLGGMLSDAALRLLRDRFYPEVPFSPDAPDGMAGPSLGSVLSDAALRFLRNRFYPEEPFTPNSNSEEATPELPSQRTEDVEQVEWDDDSTSEIDLDECTEEQLEAHLAAELARLEAELGAQHDRV